MTRRTAIAAALMLGGCTVAGPSRGGPADRTPEPPRTPPPDAPGVEPAVRVGVLVDSPTVRVSGTSGVELAAEDGTVRSRGAAGDEWTVRRSGDGLEAVGAAETVRVRSGLVVRPSGSGEVTVNGTRYRGSILVLPAERGVTAVNLLALETYLLGVVPLEIGKGRPPEEAEAVKAQAIAARTYAVRHMGRRAELGFDFFGSVMDQAYGGADAEDPVAARAVRETHGEIIVHDGEPIEAYYHSTCGGRTAALEEVWNGDPRPYLQSVSDAKPDGGWYCETSNRFRWTEEWSRSELESTLTTGLADRVAGNAAVTRVESIAITDRTASGRVATLRIRTDLGEHRIHGDSVRWVLRPEPGRILNSSAIEVHPHGDERVEGLAVEGAGWGHGIGMCQVGALGRARAGQSYREILLTYYPGTRIARLYP